MPLIEYYDHYDEKYFNDVILWGTDIKTSGSSGEPKTLHQTHFKISVDSYNSRITQGITASSKILTVLNPEKAGGLFVQTIPGLLEGADVTLKKFNPYDWVKEVNKYTHSHLTPKQAKGVMMTKGFKSLDLTGHTFVVGSEPVTYDIIEAFLSKGALVMTVWGMSEVGPNAIYHKFHSSEDLENVKKITPPDSTILGNIFLCDFKIDSNNCLWIKGNNSVFGDEWFNTKDQVIYNKELLFYTGRDGTPVDFNNPRKG